ncbi:MAG: caspase family protein [Hyphomonas sp.]|nr:SEL1-like repeat protein [Hyphomonas sp.]
MRLLLLIAWVCFALPALAQERFALVIGNAEYPAGVGRLEHTHEDADRIADALEEVGFHVTLLKDQDRTGMQAAVLKYQGELLDHPGAIGFFYYSGHGVAAAVPGNGRRNFLVPARAPVTRAEQLPLLGYRLDEIIAALSATRAKALFVVSDACRSTLPVSGSKGSGGEEDKGLVPESSVPGMLIAFATAENASAPDDGVFSSALSKEIVQTGQDASLAFLRALQDVATRRDAGRMPFFTPGLIPRDVCFASCDKGIDPGDAATWAEIRTDCEAELYLAAYPKGAYAAAAGVRRKRCQSASQGTPQTSQTAAQRLADELAGIDYASPGFRTWITLRDVAERYGFETLEQLGEEKDPNALGLLGTAYDQGIFVEQDKTRGADLFRSACELGQMVACNNYGAAFENGKGVPVDLAAAVNLFRQSCDGGEMTGCRNLGFMYEKGRGVTQDASEAVRLYRQACDGGEMSGCNNLGFMNEKGRGVAQNLSEAVRLYRQACDGGGMIGCKNLGVMYSEGLGVEQDVDEAGRLYGQACDGGDTAACKLLND